MSFLEAIIAACNAYCAWVQHQQNTQIDEIEDEIDACASRGDAAAKLRMERLAKRIQRKRERALRSSDSNTPAK